MQNELGDRGNPQGGFQLISEPLYVSFSLVLVPALKKWGRGVGSSA